ncbi:MAG: hypothetical protein WBF66_09430, partial [Dehalococcoidia bacterium]
TLEELADADLLLHVVDITHPDAARQSQTVEDTLADLGLADKPRITALNKVDRLTRRDGSPVEGLEDLLEFDLSLASNRPDAVLISAERRWGLDDLLAKVEGALALEGRADVSRWQVPRRAAASGTFPTVRDR